MPRFYFDVRDGARVVHDDVGAEFEDARSAGIEASMILHDLARQALPIASNRLVVVDMKDDSGTTKLVTMLSITAHWLV